MVSVNQFTRLLLGWLLLLVATATPVVATPGLEEPTSTGVVGYADIELDIFSGRPNPTWTVGTEEIAPFLPAGEGARAEPIEPPGLGYRGFLITYVPAETGEPVSIWVYSSRITIGEPGQERTYLDVLGLEGWLLGNATSRGYGLLLLDMGAPIVPWDEQ